MYRDVGHPRRLAAEDDLQLCHLIREEQPGSPRAQAAFAELWLRHYDAAMVSVFRLVHDRHRAEEAVAEAFAKTLRALHDGSGPHESVRGYLLIAARSEALRAPAMEQITESVEVEQLDALPEPTERDPAHLVAERDQLVRALTSLPERWRQTLLLLEVEELAPAEVARQLKMTDQALWSLAHRAKAGLREAYLQQYVDVASAECVASSRSLAKYARGALRKRQHAQVSGHLDGCETCRQQLSRISRINESLRVWVPPLMLASGLSAAQALGVSGDGVTPASTTMAAAPLDSGSRPARRQLVLLGAAGVTLLLGTVLLWNPATQPQPTDGQTGTPIEATPSDASSGEVSIGEEPIDEDTLVRTGEPRLGNGGVREQPASTARVDAPSGDDHTPGWVLIESRGQ